MIDEIKSTADRLCEELLPGTVVTQAHAQKLRQLLNAVNELREPKKMTAPIFRTVKFGGIR